MKKFARTFVLIICVSVLSIIALANSEIVKIGTKEINTSDVSSTIDSYTFANHIGMDVAVPSEQESLRMNIRVQLLEQEFEENQINLDEKEQKYAENYLDEQLSILNEMIEKGGTEKENAEEVLDLMYQYTEDLGISMEEYRTLVKQEISFSIKYHKLLDQKYQGNQELLEQDISTKADAILNSTK